MLEGASSSGCRKRLRTKTSSALACGYDVAAADYDEPTEEVVIPIEQHKLDEGDGVLMPELESDDDFCEDLDDEAVVFVSDALLSCLENEAKLETSFVFASRLAHRSTGRGERIACSLCPFRCFTSRVAAWRHIDQNHGKSKCFVCSGQKQRKVIQAMYDNDRLAGRDSMDLLARSARFLRTSIVPPLSKYKTTVDRDIRLVLTADGPVYANAAALGVTMLVRRVRNLFYSRCFANLLFRELVMSKGRLAEALTRVHLHACSKGSEVSNLYPQHGMTMWCIAHDIFSLAPVCELFEDFYSQLLAINEFETLSLDGTVKMCLAIMGQAGSASIRKDADAAAMPEEAHLRRLITVRGRSGSVLAMLLVREEAGFEIAAQLRECFTPEQLAQVKFVGVDNPSHKWHMAFKSVFPALQVLFQDVVHLALNCEKGFGGKRSLGSIALRKILTKFDAVDQKLSCTTWSNVPFAGQSAASLTQEEEKWRAIIRGEKSLPKQQTIAFLSSLGSRRPFTSREEFIRAVVCLSTAYTIHLDSKGSNKKTVRTFLFNATSLAQCAWYFNNHIHRHSVDPAGLPLLASGTTGNEALHNEVKQAFRQTIRLHQSTMATKMRVFLFGKLLSFTVARFRPTTRQMRPAQILARALASDIFEEEAWAQICEHRTSGKALQKTTTSLQRWRHLDVARVKRWLGKRPKISKRKARPIKRTVFTFKRRASKASVRSKSLVRADGRAGQSGSSSTRPMP